MIEDPSLVGGGDCQSHFHLSDRQPTQTFLHGLRGCSKTKAVSSAYDILHEDDLLLVSGTTTVVLPAAKNSQEFTVIRVGVSTVTVACTGADTINGGSTITLASQWASRTFKAVTGGWVIINGYL